MKKPSLCICPICQTADPETISTLDCGNLDQSRLYPTARINQCLCCGHIFNELTANELEGLNDYYNYEYAPANLSATDKTGDRPGSAGSLTTKRYDQLYSALSPHVDSRQNILDVGCALGGFLDYLHDKGFTQLFGIDMAETYVEQARFKKQYKIEIGNAESLPFDDQIFDLIVMEQALEHLFNPVQAFEEARRILRSGGIFCIGVPDAARYADCYFFDFYWLLLREHIQHFDIAHLALLGKQAGFDLLKYHETIHAIMTESMVMPNLYAVFRLTDSGNQSNKPDFDNFKLKRLMSIYLQQEEARQLIKRQKIAELIQSQRPVFVWGIGREFLYLYESAGLKNCSPAGLIDANPFKQSSYRINGGKIFKAEDLLPGASADSVLVITAVAHTDAIIQSAKAMGFKGRMMDLREQAVYE